jgi:TRAP-type C4-dicarboxylate transport system permease small subunit
MKNSISEMADMLETLLGALAFIAMFLAIVLQVFFRYVLDAPLVWPFQFSVYCYIYVIYIGAVMATRRQSHISFDMVFRRLPEGISRPLGVLTNAFIGIMFMVAIPSSIGYIRLVGGVPSSSLDIPWGAVLAVFPLGMGAISLILLQRAFRDAMKLLGPGGPG